MSIHISAKLSTGRAKCRICEEHIDGSDIQVTAEGYRDSGSVHLKCLVGESTLPGPIKDMLLDRIAKAKFTLKNKVDKTMQSVV
jgi:hypothetical protein